MLLPGTHICLISCPMTTKNTMLLPTIVDKIGRCEQVSYNSIVISFFCYTGPKESVQNAYNENVFSKKPFEIISKTSDHSYLVNESMSEYANAKRNIILFELALSSTLDNESIDEFGTSNISYISLLHHKLSKERKKFYFLISGTPSESKRYNQISDDDYQKMRTLIFLETLYGLNERILVLPTFNNQWVCLYSKENEYCIIDSSQSTKDIMNDSDFGRIMPVITINERTYSYFYKFAFPNTLSETQDILEYRLRELMDCYTRRLKKELSSIEIDKLFKVVIRDSLFESLLFLSTLYYIVDANNAVPEELDLLHENCMDYAQGIFQLIENSYYHVVKNNQSGWGNISFRIRKNIDGSKEAKYNYDIYVTDLSALNDNEIGIVNKLLNNYPELQSSKISLPNMFFRPINLDLANFLSINNNIAHHYGLMILSNSVLSNSGILRVRSGREAYFSDKKTPVLNEMPWYSGTAFFIRIPLTLNRHEKSHLDTIASHNISLIEEMPMLKSLNFSNLFHPGMHYFKSSNEKEQFINNLALKISPAVNSPNTVFTVDCQSLVSETDFEILAKTLFLLLSSNQNMNNVALININDKYSVIKLFRQFALFYDRKGENKYLSNKGIFLVDKNAELTLLLMGHIGDILKELYDMELIGQIDETAIAIINCLGSRLDESGKV